MPGPQAVQNLQIPHPRDWQGGQTPRSCPGGGWAQVELTDALISKNVNQLTILFALEGTTYIWAVSISQQTGKKKSCIPCPNLGESRFPVSTRRSQILLKFPSTDFAFSRILYGKITYLCSSAINERTRKNKKKNGEGGESKEERVWERDRDNDVMKQVIRFKFNISPPLAKWSPWRNRLARSAVNRKVGGSSPPGDEIFLFFFSHFFFFF